MLERHKRILMKQNPQWQDEPFKSFEFRRDLFEPVYNYLQYPQIIAVVGLRRVGKTVLLKQIIKELSATVQRMNIGYISFDDMDFQKYETADELINYFLTFSDGGEMRFLFLDEIQKVPHWPDLLKTLYDTEGNLKIVVSGSSSLEMKHYRETLAGRIITMFMPIFTFKEFVRYFGMRSSIARKGMMRDYELNFLGDKERYSLLFEQYLIKGAFPELLEVDDEDFIKRYIKESVIEKVVADVSRSVRPKREDMVYELLRIFSKNTARLFDISNIASSLGINRNTTANYIRALENSFLIKIDYNHTKSTMKQARSSKKAHIAHSSIPIALFDYPFEIMGIDGSDRGFLVESTIANSLDDTTFWRTSQKHEVDIVVQNSPVEVKYRKQITKNDLKGILKFMEKFKVGEGMVITKDIFKEESIRGKRIIYIPAWLFLLLE